MEITDTMVFVKCREFHDFAKTPCFLPKCLSLTFLKNTLFLISISLLCAFNTRIFTLTQEHLPFLRLCYHSLHAFLLTGSIHFSQCSAATKFYTCTACNDGRQCQMLSFRVYLQARDFCDLHKSLPCFCVILCHDFLLSLHIELHQSMNNPGKFHPNPI